MLASSTKTDLSALTDIKRDLDLFPKLDLKMTPAFRNNFWEKKIRTIMSYTLVRLCPNSSVKMTAAFWDSKESQDSRNCKKLLYQQIPSVQANFKFLTE